MGDQTRSGLGLETGGGTKFCEKAVALFGEGEPKV